MISDGFTAKDVLAITGISRWTLQRWEFGGISWMPWEVRQRQKLRYSAAHILRIQAVLELRKLGIPLVKAASAADDYVVMMWRRRQRESFN